MVDGRGGAPFAADLAITDGIIVDIGRIDGRGRKEIDAQGAYVTPGFVDVHTHYDGQVTWESTLSPSSNHGVTTVVMGNCGVGFAPTRSADHELVIKLMEGVEDVPEVVMAEGVPWNWETFPEYLDALDEREADVDFATQIPHSPLRVFVMGSAAPISSRQPRKTLPACAISSRRPCGPARSGFDLAQSVPPLPQRRTGAVGWRA
ncbi:amidohydrolase family protein [Novosphingobium pokkalii]|uniref:amidohydrolase family protein n=1 Tax=Novosphingobium pokkalii TaxID=1770194 RepID=UPI003626279C